MFGSPPFELNFQLPCPMTLCWVFRLLPIEDPGARLEAAPPILKLMLQNPHDAYIFPKIRIAA